MSFTRYMLASLRIAFLPKIGTPYRYASQGPFEIGPIFTPKKISCGYVLYDTLLESGHVIENAVSLGVFASVYRKVHQQTTQPA